MNKRTITQAGRARGSAYLLYRWFWESLDWLYPPQCGGCGHPGSRWCIQCQSEIKVIGGNICQRCGQPIQSSSQTACLHCLDSSPAYSALRSWTEFSGPIREALHRLKYKKDIGLGEALSRPLMEWFSSLGWHIDLVVPVPLSRGRMRERGYNQVTYLAKPFALGLGLTYKPDALSHVRETATQVGLNRSERKHNVDGAFSGKSSVAVGKTILVMDDVATTGATLDACAKALLDAGACQVYAITAARAIHF